MRTDLVTLTIEQVIEDLILDVQLSTSSRTPLSPDIDERTTMLSASGLVSDEASSTSARINSHRSTSSSIANEPVPTLTAIHSNSSVTPQDSFAEVVPATASSSISTTALQPWPPLHEPLISGPASTAPRQTETHESRSSKLLVLKKKRLESLSSSLDLSRESSFDTSAFSTQQATAAGHGDSGDTGAHGSEPATAFQAAVQHHSMKDERKTLDSTSGDSRMLSANQDCLNK